mgnify:CR=1 FL=1
MAVHRNGQDTAQSIPWGSPSPLVKTQDGEPERNVVGGNPTYDGNCTLDVPRGPRLIRFGSWNVGSMTGRSSEVVEVLERRRVDVCCVQETRWKGGSTRMVSGKSGRYKFLWQGCPEGIHGVGVLVSEEFVDKIVEVKRMSERLMMVKLVIGECLMNVISGYAPQVGRNQVEKDEFWNAVYDLVGRLKNEEMVVLGGDLNGHVGRESDGYEGVHGGFGYGVRNVEGEKILEFGDAMEMIVCGTQFKKDDNKLITYSSGGSTTTVDYLMTRKRDRKCLQNAKAIPGEEAVSQHHLILVDMKVRGIAKARRKKFCPRRRVWRLKDENVRLQFQAKLVLEEVGESDVNEVWEKARDGLLKAASEACGWTKGPPRHVQTWWWNEEVGKKVGEKKLKFKAWCQAKGTAEEQALLEEYVAAKKIAKKAVAQAQQEERNRLGEKLNTEEGQRSVFKIAKQMAKERQDVVGVNCVKDESGNIVVEPEMMKKRWKEYMEQLLNVENEWDGNVECDVVEGPRENITEMEVEKAIGKMKSGKAGGPTDLVGEIIRAAGQVGVKKMTEICNMVVDEEKIPKDWELSTLLPIYKGKGDPMECGAHRAIKLLEHGMKVLERVLERKLREKVNIDGMQFGFVPGKGTTDAIFVVRQMQEKFVAKNRALYYAFVDLEKAFDRIPREVVRWALRKLGVEEWLVKAVMTMYEKARTVVRTKNGNSEEFEVKVGVHQGSVLSPLLFAVVMEALTQEVREGLPWELLYADDLVLMAESSEELKEKVMRWKECMEAKGLKMNTGKTKVMVSGKNSGYVERLGKWPCSICGKGVGSNSIRCIGCSGWVHKRCSGVKGLLARAEDTFMCKVCERAEDGEDSDVNESMDLGNGVHLENVRKFCYLGDMLNGGGGANSASVARVRCAWGKFKELSGILTRKEVSLKLKGKVYMACVRSAMVYGSETWAMTVELSNRLERTEMRMVRWMCGVSLRDRVSSEELRERMGIESVSDVVKRSRLRWLGHVLRKDDGDWVKTCMSLEVEGARGRGRPRMTWSQVVERDMRECGLKRDDAQDRGKWRKLSWGTTGQPLRKRGKRP